MSTRRRSLPLLLTSLAVLGAASVAMAESGGYLSVRGSKLGEIKGSVVTKGREGRIKVVALAHEVVSPMDAASGQATGKRQHRPLVITKELDKSSPLLHTAQATNETLTEVKLELFAVNAKGVESNDYTVTLRNARIASIETLTGSERGNGNAQLPVLERVTFVYEQITWTWTDGGVTSTDGVRDVK